MSAHTGLNRMKDIVAALAAPMAAELLSLADDGVLPQQSKVREAAQWLARDLDMDYGQAMSIVTSEVHRACMRLVAQGV